MSAGGASAKQAAPRPATRTNPRTNPRATPRAGALATPQDSAATARAVAPTHDRLDSRFAIYRAWVATKQAQAAASNKRRDRFSDDTARIYESLWRGWVEWLGARGIEWNHARPEHIQAFLDGPAPAPADRRSRKPIRPDQMASYTRQRFWRVLQAVYSHAVTINLLASSPCVDEPANKPHVDAEAGRRRLLPAGVLQQLRDPRMLAQLLPMKQEHHWWVLRDRAAIALAAHCGLSAAELIALRGRDLSDGRGMLRAQQAAATLPGVQPIASTPRVDIPRRGERERRSLDIPPQALAVLKPWLEKRETLLRDQQRAFARRRAVHKQSAAGDAADSPVAPSLADAPVLLSREAPGGQALPPLDPPTLYVNFKRCLKKALEAEAVESNSQDAYRAHGPAVVRNSVIAAWALTLGAQEAAQRAGLKPESLRAFACQE